MCLGDTCCMEHEIWFLSPLELPFLLCPHCKVSTATFVPAANQASLSSPSGPSPPSPSTVTAGLRFLPHRPHKHSSYLFLCPTSTETIETMCLYDEKRELGRGAHPSNDTPACSTPSSVLGTGDTEKSNHHNSNSSRAHTECFLCSGCFT